MEVLEPSYKANTQYSFSFLSSITTVLLFQGQPKTLLLHELKALLSSGCELPLLLLMWLYLELVPSRRVSSRKFLMPSTWDTCFFFPPS